MKGIISIFLVPKLLYCLGILLAGTILFLIVLRLLNIKPFSKIASFSIYQFLCSLLLFLQIAAVLFTVVAFTHFRLYLFKYVYLLSPIIAEIIMIFLFYKFLKFDKPEKIKRLFWILMISTIVLCTLAYFLI